MAEAVSTSRVVCYILGLLCFGCLNTLTTKFQYAMTSSGIDGEVKLFKKPFFNCLTMFLGMSLVLPIYSVLKRVYADKEGYQAIDSADSKAKFWKDAKMIVAPAMLDLVASILCFIGLLWNSASVWQMLRGSMIIWSALLSVIFLKRKLYPHNWVGVGVCCCAVTLVGYSNWCSSQQADADDSNTQSVDPQLVMLGMGLIILGQLIQAAQVVCEELLLKDCDCPALLVVAFEGIWGSIGMFGLFAILTNMSGDDAGEAENLQDTFYMIANNSKILYLIFLYIFSVCTYNVFGMMVTKSLSSIHRTMLEASRTAVVWGVDLMIFQIAPESGFGEQLDQYSVIQLIGFFLLVIGQMIYSDIIRVPGIKYPVPEEVVIPQCFSPTGALHSPTGSFVSAGLPADIIERFHIGSKTSSEVEFMLDVESSNEGRR